MFFRNVTILGVGLIGGSLALALKRKGLAGNIVGYGRTLGNLSRAQERGIIDSFECDAAKACENAGLIVFATPVGAFVEVARAIAPALREKVIITDVGSVKGDLVGDMERLLAPRGLFVGAHPIAGSDRSGIDSASAHLFEQTRCVVTPTPATDSEALDEIVALWRTIGAVVTIVDPGEHDRIYAAVSHLPHLLAFELVNVVEDINSSYLTFAGQGFKDVTRIASSQPELWRDICRYNRQNLLAYLTVLKKNLDRVSRYLEQDDSKSLLMDFERARALRESVGPD